MKLKENEIIVCDSEHNYRVATIVKCVMAYDKEYDEYLDYFGPEHDNNKNIVKVVANVLSG